MISINSINAISHLFCGDTAGHYPYKSGPELVSFFNQYFDTNDEYGPGFPSRWMYVSDKIAGLLESGRIDAFLNIILGKEYLISNMGLTEVKAAELSEEILAEINRIIRQDFCRITLLAGRYHLTRDNDDLELIGNGGFADVYRQKSTGLVMKKLKDDFLTDEGIRSRFKREFNITQSLQDVSGILRVYSFDEDNCSYTMEEAENTLERYILENHLSDQEKVDCIRQLLVIMKEVHNRDIIHRDISPNNIFIVSGILKIADFGLGKDLRVFSSHQTLYTNAVGQYFYCAPEQFMLLRDADKRSDVYSLGRVINFIMTGDPRSYHHIYRNVSEKATNTDAVYRYADAGQLFSFFEKAVEYHDQAENKEHIDQKIQGGVYDVDVESYIYALAPEKISQALLNRQKGFCDILLEFMQKSDDQAQHIIQSIEQSFRNVCGKSYEAYDPFASFADKVLKGKYPYVVKEIAATILRYVAWDVNRFSAQDKIKELIASGIEPMLEDIIER